MTDKNNFNETMLFKAQKGSEKDIREILTTVYAALKEKGYNPTGQIVGYLLSGDPTYITAHNGARKLIRSIDRDRLLEELLEEYLNE
ncbi:MAG: IreB family regulatory phosphoprotein [Anaerococcus sp.]|nr:IreB family regulatory phosphoprotein [Anaerococcus sp.]MDD7044421.1 IreB family regulatory phosphoprotein [Peptoniphilaceae bacterium]MDY2918771.1 IreB family regulatory phosphoprotein [Anaerococcus sp.]